MSGDVAARFEPYRKRLLRHAYRMLGERAESEDVVQDAFLRWTAAARTAQIEDDLAYLRSVVTRLCIDRMRSARARREVYVGPWLPEPLVTSQRDDPEAIVALADDVSFAMLLALERLSALERAAFLLHDVMEVPFAEIAATLDRSESAVKQLASRARGHLREPQMRRKPPLDRALRLRARLAKAIASEDVTALRELLAADVVFTSDSGGKAISAIVPVRGSDKVARLLVGLSRKRGPGIRVAAALINDAPGFVFSQGDAVIQTLAFDIAVDRVVAIYSTRNPDKLRAVATDLSGTSAP